MAVMSDAIDTNQLLVQLQSMAREAGIPARADSGAAEAARQSGVVFTEVLRNSLEGVNSRSQESRALVESFELGTPGVELTDVMVAVQKARVSFEALSQVRNKMIAAYKDIMSMPL